MHRRWDLVALAALIAVPFGAVGVYARAAYDVDDVVLQLDQWLVEWQLATPKGDTLALARLAELAQHPLTAAARADVDAVLAGTKGPWEVAPSTKEQLVAGAANVLAPLASSLETATHARPLSLTEREAVADLQRHVAFLAVDARSRGRGAAADDACWFGYSLSMLLTGSGGLDDDAVATALFRAIHNACGESIGTGDREARAQAIESVLALSGKTPPLIPVLERDRALRMLSAYRTSIGSVPRAMAAHAPEGVIIDDDNPPPSPLMTRLVGRLFMRTFAQTSTEAVSTAVGPPPWMPPPFESAAASYARAITDARSADELRHATWRLLLARLVAEMFVIDHRRWPNDADQLHLGDATLDDRVQTVLNPRSLSLLVHDEHLSIMLDDKYSMRATLPDDLASLAQQPLPARDFTGRLIDRWQPRP